MKSIFVILVFLLLSYNPVSSQYKIGFQTGAAVNFQTVNSLIRNAITNQIEYRGTGQVYNMGACFNTGLTFEIKLPGNIETDLQLEYMLKKVKVYFQSKTYNNDRRYLFDLNYNYIRIPFTLKVRKSDFFYYDFGIVNNFLFHYEQEKLYRTLMSQNIKEIRTYNAGITAGFGFVVFKKYEFFLRGETDITPFLLTSDYGGDNHYPFKFHNVTFGLRYWFYQKNKQKVTS